MKPNEIVNALRATVEIIDDPGNNVVLKMLKGHMTNAANCIESLQAQLAESQRREQAAVEDMGKCGGTCHVCQRDEDGTCEGGDGCNFIWRGPQEAGERP